MSFPLPIMVAGAEVPLTGRVALVGTTLDDIEFFDFDGEGWAAYGNAGTLSNIGNPGLGLVSATRAFYINSAASADLTAYDFTDPNWASVGNPFDITATPGFSTIAPLAANRAAILCLNGGGLGAYDFDGTDFSLDGNALSLSGVGNPAMCALTPTRIVLVGATADSLRAYDFDGSDWAQVGNTLSIAPVGTFPAICALTSSLIAFIDNTNDELRAYSFDGTDFVEVATLSISGFNFGVLAAMAADAVAMAASLDDTTATLRAYRIAGSTFTQVGSSLSISETAPKAISSASYSAAGVGNGTAITVGESIDAPLTHRGYADAVGTPALTVGTAGQTAILGSTLDGVVITYNSATLAYLLLVQFDGTHPQDLFTTVTLQGVGSYASASADIYSASGGVTGWAWVITSDGFGDWVDTAVRNVTFA